MPMKVLTKIQGCVCVCEKVSETKRERDRIREELENLILVFRAAQR